MDSIKRVHFLCVDKIFENFFILGVEKNCDDDVNYNII